MNRINSCSKFLAVTPADGADLTLSGGEVKTRGILVAVAGTVSIVDENNNTISLTLTAGSIHPIATKRIRATGTTATGIVACW